MAEPLPWPFSAEGLEDPYPAYRRRQAADPVEAVPELGLWLVTGHREVTALLRDHRCLAGRVPAAATLGGGDEARGTPLHRTLARLATLRDGEAHRRVRAPLQRGFAREVLEPGRPRVRQVADALLDATGPPPVEVVAAFADPLMGAVLDEQLRLPEGFGACVRAAWPRVAGSIDDPEAGLVPEAPAELVGLHTELALVLKQVRADPQATAVDAMIGALEEDDAAEGELVANLLHAITSGHRSGAQAVALAVHALATAPEQYARLQADPGLLVGAVEELLRYDGAVLVTSRLVAEPVEVGGHELRPGELATLVLGAANRDPEAHEHADRLDVAALPARHLAFGRGEHYCVGATLARMVLHEALAALLERAPRLALAARPSFTSPRRGLATLEVAW